MGVNLVLVQSVSHIFGVLISLLVIFEAQRDVENVGGLDLVDQKVRKVMELRQKYSVVCLVHFDALVLLSHLKVYNLTQIKSPLELDVLASQRLVEHDRHDADLKIEVGRELVVDRGEFAENTFVTKQTLAC